MQHLQPNTTLQGGKYRIERVLGQGGFGITYLARNTVFDIDVAIKEFFMKDENDRDGSSVTMPNTTKQELFHGQMEKFKKEAKRMFAIKNEHIVGVQDLFEENGTAYYVMDYVDGENLAERLKRTGKPMSEQEVRDILPQILDALKSIHDAGIWHLDLKPANILIDKSGLVKLIDFGASKQLNAQKGGATTSTAISYTNGYAPIEQLGQDYRKFGPWTDIYALGATLYTLLTNHRPPHPTEIFDDDSEDKHFALPFPTGVNGEMKELILSLMNFDYRKRPQCVCKITLNPAEWIPKTIDVNEETIIDGTIKTPPSKPRKGRMMLIAASAIIIFAIIIGAVYANDSQIESKEKMETDSVNIETTALLPSSNSIIERIMDNMILVEGGIFKMGATQEQGKDAYKTEMPIQTVRLYDFYIGKYEVTQEEWMAVMGYNPSTYNGENKPVETVDWQDCQNFISQLNSITGEKFRLPTEAEWEYAARGGQQSKFFKYSGGDNLNDVAWYEANSNNMTHPVGQKLPNELGLYDMSGNVWEWCNDWYGVYSSDFQINPLGAKSSPSRVNRGGGFLSIPRDCRSSNRDSNTMTFRSNRLGLRLAIDRPKEIKKRMLNRKL